MQPGLIADALELMLTYNIDLIDLLDCQILNFLNVFFYL